MPPLTTLRTFAAAARRESVREGAAALGVTPSAVSHQIRVLENWIGAALFTRSIRQVRLTPLGRDLYLGIEQGFAGIARALAAARVAASNSTLRISALPLFTSVWLIPRLERFQARAPDLAIRIDTSNALADLDAGEIDIAIRNIPDADPRLVCRKLLDLRVVPLCSQALSERVTCADDLAHVTLIDIAAGPNGWTQWLAAAGCGHVTGQSRLSFDTIPAALEAAAMGRGVVLGLDPLVWDASAARDLVVPFGAAPQSGGAYFVVHRRSDHARRAVRLFCDWIAEEMKADSRRLKSLSKRADGEVLRRP